MSIFNTWTQNAQPYALDQTRDPGYNENPRSEFLFGSKTLNEVYKVQASPSDKIIGRKFIQQTERGISYVGAINAQQTRDKADFPMIIEYGPMKKGNLTSPETFSETGKDLPTGIVRRILLVASFDRLARAKHSFVRSGHSVWSSYKLSFNSGNVINSIPSMLNFILQTMNEPEIADIILSQDGFLPAPEPKCLMFKETFDLQTLYQSANPHHFAARTFASNLIWPAYNNSAFGNFGDGSTMLCTSNNPVKVNLEAEIRPLTLMWTSYTGETPDVATMSPNMKWVVEYVSKSTEMVNQIISEDQTYAPMQPFLVPQEIKRAFTLPASSYSYSISFELASAFRGPGTGIIIALTDDAVTNTGNDITEHLPIQHIKLELANNLVTEWEDPTVSLMRDYALRVSRTLLRLHTLGNDYYLPFTFDPDLNNYTGEVSLNAENAKITITLNNPTVTQITGILHIFLIQPGVFWQRRVTGSNNAPIEFFEY